MVTSLQYQYKLRFLLDEPKSRPFAVEHLDVERTLRRLLQQDLTFKGDRTNYATHTLHAFAAKFPPQLPRLFIQELTRPGEWILDPMGGSGTALVETVLLGRNAIGIDLDPLASLISRVKTTPLQLPQCTKVGAEVLRKASRNLHSEANKALNHFYSPQAVAFFNYWFEDRVINELHALIRAIDQVKETEIRNLLRTVFSSIIITKTGGVSRARDLAHSRPHRDGHKRIKQSVLDIFAWRLNKVVDSLEEVVNAKGNAIICRADTRALPIADRSVNLIFTSPPYAANAIDYVRAHKFSLIWFGHIPETLTALRRRYIGSELPLSRLKFVSDTANRILKDLHRKDARKAAVVAHYFEDMEIAMREMLRVLTEGAAAILVVGSSTIRGLDIRVPNVLTELAPPIGFRVVGVAKREIVRNARMMPVSHNSTRDGIEARMHEEGVIGLIKPKRRQV